MSEQAPTSEVRGKFACTRDRVLYQLSLNGWGIAGSGDLDGPYGWFSYTSNSEAELPALEEALGESFAAAGLEDPTELVGSFLMLEDNLGFVDVGRYDSEEAVKADYERLEALHQQWVVDNPS